MRRYNIVDLFSGTGGMGLAALATAEFRETGRIVWTAEANPRYTDAISRNHKFFSKVIGEPHQVPERCAPVDLSKKKTITIARGVKDRWRQIDLMLAGPPCQGFSLANRLSRNHENPQNQLSLMVLNYVRVMEPRILILENVPGIRTLQMSAERVETATNILQRRLRRMGYGSSILELNAADYGVPQFRLRTFLIAVKGTGSLPENIAPAPSHGVGRRFAHVTVADALGDLPRAVNGSCEFEAAYAKSASCSFQRLMRRHSNGVFSDHITSRHSAYVLERYSRIPQGGNWTFIRRMLSNNYEKPSRTHRNIYYRLNPKAPARTIGNFRKAMTIHPWQDRGLSLREAARLQSIPDWFRFANPSEPIERDVVRGLNAYQQQIGNAVSYLLTQKLVSHVAKTLDL